MPRAPQLTSWSWSQTRLWSRPHDPLRASADTDRTSTVDAVDLNDRSHVGYCTRRLGPAPMAWAVELAVGHLALNPAKGWRKNNSSDLSATLS